jgi:hypothetical protein
MPKPIYYPFFVIRSPFFVKLVCINREIFHRHLFTPYPDLSSDFAPGVDLPANDGHK